METENQQQLLVPIKDLEILEKSNATAADEVDDHWGDDLDLARLVDDSSSLESDGSAKPQHQGRRPQHSDHKRKTYPPKGQGDSKADGEQAEGQQKKPHFHKKPHGSFKPKPQGGPSHQGGGQPNSNNPNKPKNNQ